MSQLAIFHNTIPLRGMQLEQASKKAETQKDKILQLFKDHPYTSFTAYQVHLHFGQQMKESSVRRAVADLVFEGKLKATGEVRDGGSGINVNCWILNN